MTDVSGQGPRPCRRAAWVVLACVFAVAGALRAAEGFTDDDALAEPQPDPPRCVASTAPPRML